MNSEIIPKLSNSTKSCFSFKQPPFQVIASLRKPQDSQYYVIKMDDDGAFGPFGVATLLNEVSTLTPMSVYAGMRLVNPPKRVPVRSSGPFAINIRDFDRFEIKLISTFAAAKPKWRTKAEKRFTREKMIPPSKHRIHEKQSDFKVEYRNLIPRYTNWELSLDIERLPFKILQHLSNHRASPGAALSSKAYRKTE